MRAKQSKKETLMVVSKWDITLDILEKIQTCMSEGLFTTGWVEVRSLKLIDSLSVYFKHLGYDVVVDYNFIAIRLSWEEDTID